MKSLEQESVYDSKGSAAARIMKTRLIVQRPNKLVLEITERSSEEGRHPSSICLGWQRALLFQRAAGILRQGQGAEEPDGIPRTGDVRGVGRDHRCRSVCDARTAIKIRYLGEFRYPRRNRLQCRQDRRGRRAEDRRSPFYIGKEDHFLRKFLFDSKPIPKPEPKGKKLLPDLPIPRKKMNRFRLWTRPFPCSSATQ